MGNTISPITINIFPSVREKRGLFSGRTTLMQAVCRFVLKDIGQFPGGENRRILFGDKNDAVLADIEGALKISHLTHDLPAWRARMFSHHTFFCTALHDLPA